MTNTHTADWLSLNWTDWGPLRTGAGHVHTFSTDAGLYRIRHPEYDGLVYVGETGRSVRGRVRALARGTYADEMPYRDPHTAAPTLWAINDQSGPEFEVSNATPDRAASKQTRKGIEAALIALHRRELGQSPTANFGRMVEGYRQSSYSSDGLVGGPLPDGKTEANAAPGGDPLPWTNADDPLADQWMGIEWSAPKRLFEASPHIPEVDGVYRLSEPEREPALQYIGQSTDLRSRLYRHRRNRDNDLRFSYATLPDHDARHKREEIETELLGAHWLACDSAPTLQF